MCLLVEHIPPTQHYEAKLKYIFSTIYRSLCYYSRLEGLKWFSILSKWVKTSLFIAFKSWSPFSRATMASRQTIDSIFSVFTSPFAIRYFICSVTSLAACRINSSSSSESDDSVYDLFPIVILIGGLDCLGFMGIKSNILQQINRFVNISNVIVQFGVQFRYRVCVFRVFYNYRQLFEII